MTIDILKNFGVDTGEGLARCMNNEEFYLKMVDMGLKDKRFDTLGPVLESGDMDEAFEICHALKGVVLNLALKPLSDPIANMTEMLRNREETDYTAMYREIKAKRDEILSAS
ncbi:MAG: Hpt domain-containing protein [Lachnospiraceae bacterium]|nr:Hpt domain-containing protein [Lachnospiraceae bacterium]